MNNNELYTYYFKHEHSRKHTLSKYNCFSIFSDIVVFICFADSYHTYIHKKKTFSTL